MHSDNSVSSRGAVIVGLMFSAMFGWALLELLGGDEVLSIIRGLFQ